MENDSERPQGTRNMAGVEKQKQTLALFTTRLHNTTFPKEYMFCTQIHLEMQIYCTCLYLLDSYTITNYQ